MVQSPAKSSAKESPNGPFQAEGPRLPLAALLALSGATFVSLTTEFIPGGLIPNIAAEFEVGVSQVGMLIAALALAVIVSATPLSALTRRLARKPVVLVFFGLIAIANVLTAVAPSFEVVFAARVLGGIAHALFWSVVAAYPIYLVPPKRLGRATAITAAGGAVAGVWAFHWALRSARRSAGA